ncbi:MAG: rolling circle replication-associated protein [Stenotrophobium sp.]
MAETFGIENLGFLTLTFADHVTDVREASRRFNSLAGHVLRERYRAFVRVLERQKSGRIHYHLLVALPAGVDIRTGVNFAEIEQQNYSSALPALRTEWAFWRRTAKLYRFGRTELLPIYSTSEAIGKYVGKYISKHLHQREERDKGARLVTYSGPVKVRTRFAWVSPGARRWRLSLGALCWGFYEAGRIPFPNEQGMRLAFGPRWAWHWKDVIAGGAA